MMTLKRQKVVTIGIMVVTVSSAILECIKSLNAESTEEMVNRIIDERLGNNETDDLKWLITSIKGDRVK